MLLGLDVGGTFTDGAVVKDGKIISTVKTPTTHDNLLTGILAAIDQSIAAVGSQDFARISLSTTIVTNALATGQTDPVQLAVIPGPGMDITGVLPVKPWVLRGYTDHRGQEIAKLDYEEIRKFAAQAGSGGKFAVSGKFSVRNPRQEQETAQVLQEFCQPEHITLGSAMSGALNFWRRTTAAYYNAAVWRHFNDFANAAEAALAARGIAAPVYVLKADGGTLPLAAARRYPVEAVFTGPAAGVMGIMAMAAPQGAALSLDIGGTTTDLALWQGGVPQFAAGGAVINDYPTALRSFKLKSIAVGGDSTISREANGLQIGPGRLGPAMAAGGPKPTITDALVVLGLTEFGDKAAAVTGISQLILPGQNLEAAASEVINAALERIGAAIDSMLQEEAAQPVYTVQDMLKGTAVHISAVIGAGGAAGGLVPQLAKRLGLPWRLPPQGMVANAIGAAVARPTAEVTLRADTVTGYYTVSELGIQEKLPSGPFTLAKAQMLAQEYLAKLCENMGIKAAETEMLQAEEFNVVQGFSTRGKIITCRVQVKPGVLFAVEEER